MSRPIKIIDLFAGPGGLGEGFSALKDKSGNPAFKIALSIEKEPSARQTLQLRAFYRQFPEGEAPAEYYRFLEGRLGKTPGDALLRLANFEKQVAAADAEARQLTLGEDNRKIYAAIRAALGKRPGPWVLIGGPPCQAYSVVGRSRNKGIKSYRIEEDHRSSLYLEYLKIIYEFSPAVFVMENVKGLLSAQHNGESIFEKILDDLANPGRALKKKRLPASRNYEVRSFVANDPQLDLLGRIVEPREFLIKSENYGVPQARHRVILLGIRRDVTNSEFHKVLTKQKSIAVDQVIGDLPPLRSGLSKSHDSLEAWQTTISRHAGSVITAVQKAGMTGVAELMQEAVSAINSRQLERGDNFAVTNRRRPRALKDWYADPSGWKKICNHETRGHIPADLMRYLFCSAFAKAMPNAQARTPRADQFPAILAPHHKNWQSGHFSDRFRAQVATRAGTTVTSHISKDGHYFIHFDPAQCRSLTVREAARIQTFPDNYFFVGNRTQQYVQVGNAVPPCLANQIAEIVHGAIRQ